MSGPYEIVKAKLDQITENKHGGLLPDAKQLGELVDCLHRAADGFHRDGNFAALEMLAAFLPSPADQDELVNKKRGNA